MPRSKTPVVRLEEAKARFEAWRQNRKGREAIPDELWMAAVEVARKEGVSRTSTELRVEWNHLKRRDGRGSRSMPEAQRRHSWNWSRRGHSGSGMRHRSGRSSRGKLRIQLKNTTASYLAALSRALWESAS